MVKKFMNILRELHKNEISLQNEKRINEQKDTRGASKNETLF